MNVILTNIDNPLVSESINRGHIVIDELKVWSGWKQHSNFIASYQWRSQPNVVRRIEIGNDKVVTFKVISEAFNSKLNESSAGATIAKLSYVDGKVILYLKPDTQLFNVRISDEIARALKIKPDRPNTGETRRCRQNCFSQRRQYFYDVQAGGVTTRSSIIERQRRF